MCLSKFSSDYLDGSNDHLLLLGPPCPLDYGIWKYANNLIFWISSTNINFQENVAKWWQKKFFFKSIILTPTVCYVSKSRKFIWLARMNSIFCYTYSHVYYRNYLGMCTFKSPVSKEGIQEDCDDLENTNDIFQPCVKS